jgi:predicted O-linked N-acetylglucosamine transferase (SPINDLY family)
MGAAFMDYIVADPMVLPAALEQYFDEAAVRLPDTYWVVDSTVPVPPPPSRAEAGLPECGFVFCCFNNSWKIRAPIFDVWMRLLTSVEGSVLWLYRANDAAADNLHAAAHARGIDPARIVFAPRAPQADHIARQQLADLCLDTLPYNAHTTASDALWAGVPMVTCRGHGFVGRVAESQLRAVGLPDLVTDSLADYEALAQRLATDPAALKAVRERLAQNRSTCALFDTGRFTRHLETAYIEMWERWRRGEPPSPIDVPPLPR